MFQTTNQIISLSLPPCHTFVFKIHLAKSQEYLSEYHYTDATVCRLQVAQSSVQGPLSHSRGCGGCNSSWRSLKWKRPARFLGYPPESNIFHGWQENFSPVPWVFHLHLQSQAASPYTSLKSSNQQNPSWNQPLQPRCSTMFNCQSEDCPPSVLRIQQKIPTTSRYIPWSTSRIDPNISQPLTHGFRLSNAPGCWWFVPPETQNSQRCCM